MGDAAIKGTEGILDAAGTVARGVAAAGQAVLDELQQVAGDTPKKTEPEAGDETSASDSSAKATEKDGTEGDSDVEADERPA